MRKFLISAALIGTTLAAAMPASAQSWGGPPPQDGGYDRGYDRGYDDRGSTNLWQLRQAVDRAIQTRRLSPREADYFRRELGNLFRMDAQFRRDGYNGRERRELDRRSGDLFQRLRYAQNDGRGGWDGPGRGSDRDHDGRWDR